VNSLSGSPCMLEPNVMRVMDGFGEKGLFWLHFLHAEIRSKGIFWENTPKQEGREEAHVNL
jgi:hypothetical protein